MAASSASSGDWTANSHCRCHSPITHSHELNVLSVSQSHSHELNVLSRNASLFYFGQVYDDLPLVVRSEKLQVIQLFEMCLTTYHFCAFS